LENLGLNLGFLLVQIANFAIIFIVLRAWVYKPLMGVLEKRKAVAAQGLEDARLAAEARENAEADASKIIKEAQLRASEIVREATERAEVAGRDVRAAADAEAAKAREASLAELDVERNRILSDVRHQVVTLAMAAAHKLIGESLTEERQRSLLKEFFSGIQGGKVVVLEGAEFSGEAAEITSALPLTDDEKLVMEKDLHKILGVAAPVNYKVDPAILGGVTIRVGDRVLDGSVAGQLQGLRTSLQ
jgi:F-type H+-transporting ATPase subunit b